MRNEERGRWQQGPPECHNRAKGGNKKNAKEDEATLQNSRKWQRTVLALKSSRF